MRRIGLLSSWPWDVKRGSGTARLLADLAAAIRERGASIVPIRADLDDADPAAFVLRRLAWNAELSRDPRLADLDAILALDYDGFLLPDPPAAPPKVALPQAVFAELAPTEPEPSRSLLLVQAEAERRNVRRSAAVIAASRYVAGAVARHYGADPSRVHVVPHGFDAALWERLVREAPREPRAGPTILAVAKLYPRKGIDILLRAVARLRDRFPGLHLRIVGDGMERDRLDALAAELALSDLVRFEGDVDARPRVAAFYANADLFCLPSRQEGFGFVYLEAMAAGLPIVAVSAAAVPEVVGDAGLLVPRDDPAALAEAIGRVLSDAGLARRLAEAGHARASRFPWTASAARYLEVVEAILR